MSSDSRGISGLVSENVPDAFDSSSETGEVGVTLASLFFKGGSKSRELLLDFAWRFAERLTSRSGIVHLASLLELRSAHRRIASPSFRLRSLQSPSVVEGGQPMAVCWPLPMSLLVRASDNYTLTVGARIITNIELLGFLLNLS